MRNNTVLLIAGSLAVVLGCGPQLSPDDLGTFVYEVPKFDPVDQKYPLPKLKEPPAGALSHEGHGDSHDGHHHAHDGHNHDHDHSHP
jgi:hypothetical protein